MVVSEEIDELAFKEEGKQLLEFSEQKSKKNDEKKLNDLDKIPENIQEYLEITSDPEIPKKKIKKETPIEKKFQKLDIIKK